MKKKLDQILDMLQANLNPNVQHTNYDCRGTQRTSGPSATAAFEVNMIVGGNDSDFQQMVTLNNGHQYRTLLDLCTKKIEASPEWLTPYLFCGLAQYGMNNVSEAKKMLDHYERLVGPPYSDVSECKQMSEFLHSRF